MDNVDRKMTISETCRFEEQSSDSLPNGQVSSDHEWINTRFHYMRWVVIFMNGMGMFLVIFSRLSISVAIIDMVNQTIPIPNQFPNPNLTNSSDLENYADDQVAMFDWDNTTQYFLITVYMFAYGIPQIPLSILIEKKGGHKIGAYSLTIGLIACAAIPLVAQFGWHYVALCRIILGASHCGMMTIGVHMIEIWLPANDTSMGVTVFQFLNCVAVVFNPLLSGYLTAINWIYAYYVPSLATLVWVILWLVIVTDNPEDCWLVSQKELELILGERNYNKQVVDNTGDLNEQQQPVIQKNAWNKVLKLPTFYAYLYTWMVHCVCAYCFAYTLPGFLIANDIAADDIAENGRIVFIIQSGAIVSYFWGVKLLSWLIGRDVSKNQARKIVLTISTIIVSATWILPSLIGGSPVWMFLLNRLAHSPVEIILMDTLLDNFSGAGISASVFGVINTIGNGANFPFGVIIGRVLDIYESSLTCWHSIFFAFSSANIVALIIYCICCNSDPIDFGQGKSLPVIVNNGSKKDQTTSSAKHKLQE